MTNGISVARSFALTMVAATCCFAQSGAAITYVMPPGGEGAAAVALGVALPGGAPSMEVNPALLAWEGARTSSILQMSTSESNLLPELHLVSPLTETVRSVALRYPIKPGTDIALGYSYHQVDFGTSQAEDQTFHSKEDVQHVVLAGRLGGIASLGVGWKWLDSRLAPGIVLDGVPRRGTASASTWDVGVLVAPRWKIPATPLRIGPSLGMSYINVFDDSINYIAGDPKDPVERVRRWGVAGVLTAPDLFSAEVFQDEEVDLASWNSQQTNDYLGWSIELLGTLRWSSADLSDPSGKRDETQTAFQVTADLKQISRLLWRLKNQDIMTQIGEVPEGYVLPTWRFLGTNLTPNVRITWTKSEITQNNSDGIREGQQRVGWAISL